MVRRLIASESADSRIFPEAQPRFAFQRLANREQEDGILAFRVRRKETNHVIIEECKPGSTQRWAYAARYILTPMSPTSSSTAR
jgi:hypothetical protein